MSNEETVWLAISMLKILLDALEFLLYAGSDVLLLGPARPELPSLISGFLKAKH